LISLIQKQKQAWEFNVDISHLLSLLVKAKSASQYMEWMGQLQSHHSYRKHQMTSNAESDTTPHQQSPSDGRHVIAPMPAVFSGSYTALIGIPGLLLLNKLIAETTANNIALFSNVLAATAAFVELTIALHMMLPWRAVSCHRCESIVTHPCLCSWYLGSRVRS